MKFRDSTISRNKLMMGLLITGFVIYNAVLYNQKPTEQNTTLSESALAGARLYQANNCTACHQFYGLGGYLGPDLTNAASNGENATKRIKSFLNLGYKSMPKFDFSEKELNDITQFLIEVDQTGHYPDCIEKIHPSGWVEIKSKNESTAK